MSFSFVPVHLRIPDFNNDQRETEQCSKGMSIKWKDTVHPRFMVVIAHDSQ